MSLGIPYAKLIGAVVVLAIIGGIGGRLYFIMHQRDKLLTELATTKQDLEAANGKVKRVQNQLAEAQRRAHALSRKYAAADKAASRSVRAIHSHDLGKLARGRPVLLGRRATAATNQLFHDLAASTRTFYSGAADASETASHGAEAHPAH